MDSNGFAKNPNSKNPNSKNSGGKNSGGKGWWASKGAAVAGIAGVLVACCCLNNTMSSVEVMFSDTPHIWLAVTAAAAVAAAVAAAWSQFRARRARLELEAWTDWQRTGTDGPWPWEKNRHWPWQTRLLDSAVATVQSGWSGFVDGLPVRAGALIWNGTLMTRMTGKAEGAGIFACVQLPRALPAMAVYRREPAVGKAFAERFTVLGAEAPALVGHVLRIVHIDGTVPAWTLTGTELFTFASLGEPARPRHLRDLAQRTAWVAQLLLLEQQAEELRQGQEFR